MANTLLTPSIIAKEAAIQVVNNLVFGRLAYKDFKNDFSVKVGDTISYRKPVKFESKSGAVLQLQSVSEASDTIQITEREHVAWPFSATELTLTIDQYSERYIKPAVIALSQKIDFDGALLYKKVFNAVGAAGDPVAWENTLAARRRMNEFSVPMQNRYMALSPEHSTSIMEGMKGLFQPSLIEDITKEAALGRLSGFDLFESQNVVNHIAGTANAANFTVGTNVANGATSVSLVLGTGTGTLKDGDILSFSGCNAVNPLNKQDLGYEHQFAVVGDYNFPNTNPVVVTISPKIVTTGAHQNVTAAPTTSSTVTKLASHTGNIAWMKNAFSLITVPIVAPDSAAWAETQEYQGVSIRLIKDYDVTNDEEICRLDVMYGWKATYPEFACRVLGTA